MEAVKEQLIELHKTLDAAMEAVETALALVVAEIELELEKGV